MSNSMTFVYIRVSSKNQKYDRQELLINEYCAKEGIKIDRVYMDKVSGHTFVREQYEALKANLRSGDLLIIKELDRLGRNNDEIKKEWAYLQDKGIDIVIIDTPILNTRAKTDLEKKLIADIVFAVFAYKAEKERDDIRKRQAEGIRSAKLQGKEFGRPQKDVPDNWNEVYNLWKKGEITAVKAMEVTGLSKATFYRMVRRQNCL